jgi:hypothetical protein
MQPEPQTKTHTSRSIYELFSSFQKPFLSSFDAPDFSGILEPWFGGGSILPETCTYKLTLTAVNVQKWDGTNWNSLGTTLDNDPSKIASNPAIAIDSSGTPIVTWNENQNIFVKRFNRIP